MSRSSWITLFIALIIGLGLGLYVGWVVSPVQYTDTAPISLAQTYKDDYVLLIATRYVGDGNLDTARAGLQSLGLTEAGLVEVTLRFIAAQKPENDIRRLVALAAGVGVLTPEMQPYLP